MRRLFILICAGMMLGSCGVRVKGMRQDVNRAADQINSYFVQARESVIKLDTFTEGLLADQSKYDLSIDKMEVKNGGKYKFYNNTMFYKYTNDGGAAIMATGFFPVNDSIKKKIRLFENAEPLMKSLVNNDFSDMVIMDQNNAMAFTYPWLDWVSTLPVKFDFRNFPWITLADTKNNPSRSHVWLSEPFVILGGKGWVVVCIAPVDQNGKFDSVISEDVYLTRIGVNTLRDAKSMLLFVTDKGSVISANQLAQETLKLKVLKEYDYLKQMKENVFIQDEFLLTYKDNSKDIKSFGEELLKRNQFDITINGQEYSVYKRNLTELSNLAVVGLVRK